MTRSVMKKHTVKSVAKHLGVSTATVSNAFNRPDQLSEVLRQKILTECQRIGYHGPNPAARSLRTGSTGVVGVMLADKLAYNFSDPCAIEFLRGVSQVFDDAQVNMLMMPGSEEFYREKSLEAVAERYIIYGPPRDLGILDRIQLQRKPIVTVDFILPNHLALNVDNYGGAKAAARHLFEQGCHRVAIIGLRLTQVRGIVRMKGNALMPAELSISRQRLEAYLDAARDFDVNIPEHMIWSTSESSWHDGILAAREALSLNPRPEALLCMSDQLAMAAISVAREMNLKLPDDLKIIGFDDTPTARTHFPQVSTVYQPSIEKGRLAAMMALHPERHQSRTLPTTLLVRQTS